MQANSFKLLQRTTIAATLLASGAALAAGSTRISTETTEARPIVVAQAPVVRSTPTTVVVYPTIDTRVRAIAAEGPDALRRFLWRTRGIYNYYYGDFVPQM